MALATRKIVKFPVKQQKHQKNQKKPKRVTWQGNDSIFFHRRQVKIGTELVCWGRLNHGQIWTVDKVTDFSGKPRPEGVVVRLSDVIHLVCKATKDSRFLSFAGASYAANWRLLDENGDEDEAE